MVSPTFTPWAYPYSCSQGIPRLFASLLMAIIPPCAVNVRPPNEERSIPWELGDVPQLFHALEPAVEPLGTRRESGIENDFVRPNPAAALDVALYLVERASEDQAALPQGVLGDLKVGAHNHL